MLSPPTLLLIIHLFIHLPLSIPRYSAATPRSHYYGIEQQLRGWAVFGHKLYLGFVLSRARARLVHKR